MTQAATPLILQQLRAMQADSFRAKQLQQIRKIACLRVEDIARRLALHLAVLSTSPRSPQAPLGMVASQYRERRAKACRALAEDMLMAAMAHLHDDQWDPCAPMASSNAPTEALPGLLLSLLQMDDLMEESEPDDDAAIEQ